MSSDVSTVEAYRHCEWITRTQAANFYYGIRLLARDRRRAMSAVYAFARRVDDIGDGELEREEKLSRLAREERAVAELDRPERDRAQLDSAARPDPVMVALADAYERFALPPRALGELIEGVRMDVNGVTYQRFEDLVVYCRRVAGAIGRVCLAIFGVAEAQASSGVDAGALADDLGVALQLTNILRDVREDAENGRIYLPAEDLRRFGVIGAGEEPGTPAVLASLARPAVRDRARGVRANGADARDAQEWGRLEGLVRFEADRAQEWFHRGMELAPMLDRRSAACVLAMAGIYHRLLDRIEADPERVLRGRVSLPVREKVWVATRSMLGGSR
jgi:15-cis-phytoene synthase